VNKNNKEESLLDKFLEESKNTNFKLDLSKMKDVIAFEKQYNKKGEERLENLYSLGARRLSKSDHDSFVFGYSECGQDMHNQIIKLNEEIKIIETKNRELEDVIKELKKETDGSNSKKSTLEHPIYTKKVRF
jgi:hypothetical protein